MFLVFSKSYLSLTSETSSITEKKTPTKTEDTVGCGFLIGF